MEFLIVLMFLTIGFGGFVLWIWALIDCIKYETDENNERVVWVVVIVAVQLVGALIYLIVRRPRRKAILGR